MSTEINLLRGKKSRRNALLNKLAMLRMVSLSFLFIVSFSSIVLFMLIALSPLPSLQQRESEESKTMSFFDQKIAKILLTKERITHINGIIKTRPAYAETLQHIRAQVPEDLVVDSVKLVGNKIEVNVSGKTLEKLDSFSTNILKMNGKEKRFKRIMLTGLTLDTDTGRYVMSLELDNV